ncbi:hypothetical protein CERZMDRAFT_96816 [Cercospora zeae-maydis SCOH1-5]|uniref:Uncharacterized protein n=1 Tax=Cercospora zeae-maydis SCOH1-5 TaxID=717836 RepID=A0A6A6FI84_9PEZI|nr:hypothetical protein CERZMDRAFT_96816 [Cercospora zeae-maydis SCOH1-5]
MNEPPRTPEARSINLGKEKCIHIQFCHAFRKLDSPETRVYRNMKPRSRKKQGRHPQLLQTPPTRSEDDDEDLCSPNERVPTQQQHVTRKPSHGEHMDDHNLALSIS